MQTRSGARGTDTLHPPPGPAAVDNLQPAPPGRSESPRGPSTQPEARLEAPRVGSPDLAPAAPVRHPAPPQPASQAAEAMASAGPADGLSLRQRFGQAAAIRRSPERGPHGGFGRQRPFSASPRRNSPGPWGAGPRRSRDLCEVAETSLPAPLSRGHERGANIYLGPNRQPPALQALNLGAQGGSQQNLRLNHESGARPAAGNARDTSPARGNRGAGGGGGRGASGRTPSGGVPAWQDYPPSGRIPATAAAPRRRRWPSPEPERFGSPAHAPDYDFPPLLSSGGERGAGLPAFPSAAPFGHLERESGGSPPGSPTGTPRAQRDSGNQEGGSRAHGGGLARAEPQPGNASKEPAASRRPGLDNGPPGEAQTPPDGGGANGYQRGIPPWGAGNGLHPANPPPCSPSPPSDPASAEPPLATAARGTRPHHLHPSPGPGPRGGGP